MLPLSATSLDQGLRLPHDSLAPLNNFCCLLDLCRVLHRPAGERGRAAIAGVRRRRGTHASGRTGTASRQRRLEEIKELLKGSLDVAYRGE